MGLRVWNATTLRQASFLKCERNSAGVTKQDEKRHLRRGDSERTAKRDIVKVGRGLNRLHLSSDIERVYAFVQVRDGGMGRVIRAKNLHCLLDLVGLVHVLDWKCIELYRNGAGLETNQS